MDKEICVDYIPELCMSWVFQLMVAATLILLCTKPIDVAVLGPVPWLLTVPSIAIIGREVRYVAKLIVIP